MAEVPDPHRQLRCLWLTRDYPYPAHAGDLIYSGCLVQSLAEAGADLTVFCSDRPGAHETLEDGQGLIRWKVVAGRLRRPISSLFSTLPNVPHRRATPTTISALSELLRDGVWDVVVFDHLGTGWALSLLKKIFPTPRQRPMLVYASQNHEETARFRMAGNYRKNLFVRAALYLDAVKASRLERALVEAADLVTTTTSEDRLLFARSHPETQYLVLTPGYKRNVVRARRITRSSRRRAVVLGSFDWLAKQMDLLEFLEVADSMFAAAGAELYVVGRAPEPFLAAIRGRFRATTFTGAVEDTSPHLDGARIGIVAERTGHGFKLKVLDYVFNRVPVAAVDESVSGMGMPLIPGESILTYPDMLALSHGVLGALDDVERLNRLQQNAFVRCLGQFDWQSRGLRLLSEMSRLAAARLRP
jgi:glycosyl transferase family 1